MATIAALPTPETTGLLYSTYDKPEPDYAQATFENKFTDGGISVNTVIDPSAPVAAQRWLFSIDGLEEFEADIFSAHYRLAIHNLNDFPFTEINGTLQEGVRYLKFERKYIEDEKNAGWFRITVELIQYP